MPLVLQSFLSAPVLLAGSSHLKPFVHFTGNYKLITQAAVPTRRLSRQFYPGLLQKHIPGLAVQEMFKSHVNHHAVLSGIPTWSK